MRLFVLAALVSSVASASVVTADEIVLNVGPADLLHDVFGPGSVMWRIPVIVSGRLTNTGADDVLLNSIGGGSSLFPTTQIISDGIIAAGGFIAGPMFAADIVAALPLGPDLTDQEIIDGVTGSAYLIYRLDGSPLENNWLIPPPGEGSQPQVAVLRWPGIPPIQNDPGEAPEPSTFALVGIGLAGAVYALRRRG